MLHYLNLDTLMVTKGPQMRDVPTQLLTSTKKFHFIHNISCGYHILAHKSAATLAMEYINMNTGKLTNRFTLGLPSTLENFAPCFTVDFNVNNGHLSIVVEYSYYDSSLLQTKTHSCHVLEQAATTTKNKLPLVQLTVDSSVDRSGADSDAPDKCSVS